MKLECSLEIKDNWALSKYCFWNVSPKSLQFTRVLGRFCLLHLHDAVNSLLKSLLFKSEILEADWEWKLPFIEIQTLLKANTSEVSPFNIFVRRKENYKFMNINRCTLICIATGTLGKKDSEKEMVGSGEWRTSYIMNK
jgi:hypothetical protein